MSSVFHSCRALNLVFNCYGYQFKKIYFCYFQLYVCGTGEGDMCRSMPVPMETRGMRTSGAVETGSSQAEDAGAKE